MQLNDWIRALDQARELGAGCIVFLVELSSQFSQVFDLMEFVVDQEFDLWVNCSPSALSAVEIERCAAFGTSLILRLDAKSAHVQDWLDGNEGALEKFDEAFQSLRRAGYPDERKRMGVHFSLSKENQKIAGALWRHLKNLDIDPFFDLALEPIHFDGTRDGKLLAPVNWSKMGFDECPGSPPFDDNHGLVESHTCFVDSDGTVFPSENLPIPLGSVKKNTLKEIFSESEFYEDLSRRETTIKSPCRTCTHAPGCFGSRIAAYQLTGDYLAPDPTCWKNEGKEGSITGLPMNLDGVIPQEDPMRIVDTLEAIGDRTGIVSVTLRSDMPMVTDDGELEPAFFLEMIAQAMAGVTCFKKLGTGEREAEGLLLGAKDLEIFHRPSVGDRLVIHVHKYAQFGEFGMVRGRIEKDGQTMCRGDFKFWHRVETLPFGEEKKEEK